MAANCEGDREQADENRKNDPARDLRTDERQIGERRCPFVRQPLDRPRVRLVEAPERKDRVGENQADRERDRSEHEVAENDAGEEDENRMQSREPVPYSLGEAAALRVESGNRGVVLGGVRELVAQVGADARGFHRLRFPCGASRETPVYMWGGMSTGIAG